MNDFRGELAALGAAGLWALSSVVYALLGQQIPPLTLNFLKGIIAIVLIGLTLAISHQSLPIFDSIPVILLFFSGAIGVGIGDTAYFTALNYLGARRTLLLEILAPAIAIILAFLFLQETLTLKACFGILLTIFGVAWVISERTPLSIISKASFLKGIIWGILAAFSQAIGAVLSRYALLESGISPLWSTLLRLIAGVAIVCLLLLLSNRRMPSQRIDNTTNSSKLKLIGIISLTAFGSTYLGIWLQQIAFKYSPVGIAQTLTATSPIFVLPLAVWMGDKVSYRAILGVLIAISGICILFTF